MLHLAVLVDCIYCNMLSYLLLFPIVSLLTVYSNVRKRRHSRLESSMCCVRSARGIIEVKNEE